MFQLDFAIGVVLAGALNGLFLNRYTAILVAAILAGFTLAFGIGWGFVTLLELVVGHSIGAALAKRSPVAEFLERVRQFFEERAGVGGASERRRSFDARRRAGERNDGLYARPSEISGAVRGGTSIAHSQRSYKVIRNAAIDLFYYYDFDIIPPQFWPILETTRDPVEAFRKFLTSFGCDPEKVRTDDMDERSRTRRMLRVLTKLNGYDRFLSDEGREALFSKFFAQDYDAASEAADVLEATEAIFESYEKSRATTTMAAFANLLAGLEKVRANPLNASKERLKSWNAEVNQYLKLQIRAEALELRFESQLKLLGRLEANFPIPDEVHEALTPINDEIDNLIDRLYSDTKLSTDATRRKLDELQGLIEKFTSIIEKSEAFSRSRSSGSSSEDESRDSHTHESGADHESGTSWAPYTEVLARQFMGFSETEILTEAKLKERFRKMVKEMHPDLHADKPQAERDAINQRMTRLNESNDLLRRRL